jgi:uncharacterized protein
MNKNSKKVLPLVRKPEFNFDDLEVHYLNNNPVATHFINSLHMIFPDGEKYFIRSVKAFNDKITDTELQERVKAFISQEAQHMSAHKKLWEKLREQSPAADLFLKIYNFTSYDLIEPLTRKFLGDEFPLAVTAALEHYTAVMAEVALHNNGEILRDVPLEMKNMLLWHAAEEIEHKAVAYDVYEEVSANYPLRIAGMIYASALLSFYTFLGQAMFMGFDRSINWFDIKSQTERFGTKAKPLFEGIFENLTEYFQIDFHPDNRDNSTLSDDFLKDFTSDIKKKVVNK